MPVSPRNYSHNSTVNTTATVLVPAVTSNTKSVVRKLSLNNTSSSNRLVTLYVVQSGGVIGTANKLASKSIAPGTTWNVQEVLNEVFETGMSLQATVDAGADVNSNCSGADVT
jgi:hypothetical protein